MNEGQTVQLQCVATEQFPEGVFQWHDDGNTNPVTDAAQTPTQLRVLPNFRLEQTTMHRYKRKDGLLHFKKKPRNKKRGNWVSFTMGYGHFDGHVWRQVNVPSDFVQSFGAICATYSCCMPYLAIT